MKPKANYNKEGKIISYRFSKRGINPETGESIIYTKTWKIPFNLKTKTQINNERVKQEALFLEYVESASNGDFLENRRQEITLKEVTDKWLDNIINKNHEAYNHWHHSNHNSQFILDYFKNIKLCKLTKQKISEFYDYLNSYTYTERKYVVIKRITELRNKNTPVDTFISNLKICVNTYNKLNQINASISETTYQKLKSYCGESVNEYISIVESKKEYSQSTKKGIQLSLIGILSYAQSLDLIDKNYATSDYFKNAINGKTKEKNPIQKDEFLKIQKQIENIKYPPHKILISLYFYLGLRNCEVAGLRWSDFNFNNGSVHIQRDAVYTKKFGTQVRKTKNKSSNRILPLSEKLIDYLLDYKQYWDCLVSSLAIQDDYLFLQSNGKIANPSCHAKKLKKFLSDNNFKVVSPHVIRHSFATMCITELNLPIPNIASFLGHSKMSTTNDIYTHVSFESKNQVVQIINSL